MVYTLCLFSLIGESDKKFQDRILETINLQIEERFKQQNEQRNKERVSKIIKSIDVDGNNHKTLSDFGEESNEWLALQRFDLEEAQQPSELIRRLKKEMITYELDKIVSGVKNPSSFIVGLFTLNLLNKAAGHSDKDISRRAKYIRNKVEEAIRKDIARKYTEGTEIRYLTYTEQEVLRNSPIKKGEELRYPKNVNVLFWRLWEDEVNREEKALDEHKTKYNVSKRFNEKLQILVEILSIPRPLRSKINGFLEKVKELNIV